MMTRFLLPLLLLLAVCFEAYGQTDSTAVSNDTILETPMFWSPDYDYLKKVVSDKNSKFFYPNLMKRFKAADTTMTIEELHCLYYGSALQDDYDPYGHASDKEKRKALDILNMDRPSKRQLKKALKSLNKAIEMEPMNIDLYSYRHYAVSLLYGKESPQAGADAFRFVALVSVISYSGNGNGYATAFYVVSPSHEYSFLGFNGLRSKGQSLRNDHGKAYDVLTLDENEYGIKELYFNVDVCFSYLSRLFGNSGLSEDEEVSDMQLASYSSSEGIKANHSIKDSEGRLTIPIGNRVVIRLDTVMTGDHYEFEILSDEPTSGTFDFSKSEEYFPEEGEENTIIFYFVHSQWSEGKQCEVLMMKSFCKEMMSYDTYILPARGNSFESTSNDGIFPLVRGTEIWNDTLHAIRLSRFRPMK